jgi:hypothetical protein
MALAACENCGCPNGKSDNSYSANEHFPIRDTESGLVCGTRGCLGPASVWLLEEEEEAQYENGERVFPITGGHAGTKFRLQ